MDVIRASSLTVRLNGRVVLEDVTFRVRAPEIFCIVGPNGAGKTTLLRATLGLVKPERGWVRVLGVDPTERPRDVRRLVGYVPQRTSLNLDAPVLVRDVVLMGRAAKGRIGPFSDEDYEAAMRALEAVGLADLWDEPFRHLSGGQQQRVLLARALCAEPRLLLLDEPLTGVDLASRSAIVRVLREMPKRSVAVVMVTHDISEVVGLADEVMLLNRRVLAVGRPREVVEHYLQGEGGAG
ncbi:MAG: metal ABC transporter ATP-binding protein [Thermoprotei archaeon]|nr:MAG: metal ABC transporter ATP-binding protein [Thermoprotei archaeon]